MKEIVTYPELGKVLEGDFTPDLPVDEYIVSPGEMREPVYDVRDFGAVSGSPEVQTDKLQAALDACGETGGTVLVRGSFISGSLVIQSHTTLYVESGSTLTASRNVDDLIDSSRLMQMHMGTESSGGAFLLVKDALDVRLTGGGRISGQGAWFVHPPRKVPRLDPIETVMLPSQEEILEGKINTVQGSIRTEYRDRIRYAEDKYGEGLENLKRPSAMVWIQNCRDVTIDNIILHDSMCWTLHMDACDSVRIRNLVIDDNRHVANTDGIDLTGCRDVTVKHCLISCADDGICLKNDARTGREMRNIVIRDCRVITVMNAFKIGTGTRFPICKVLVEDCSFDMPDLYPGSVSGISVESCDGSEVEDIVIRRIRMHRVSCPVYVLLNRRNQGKIPLTEDGTGPAWGGSIRRIRLEDIRAEDADLPCLVTGFTDTAGDGTPVRRAVEDLKISDLSVRFRPCGEKVRVPEEIREFLTDYPESNAHGDVDACGLYVRHADRLSLENIRIAPRPMNTRPLLALHDVKDAMVGTMVEETAHVEA